MGREEDKLYFAGSKKHFCKNKVKIGHEKMGAWKRNRGFSVKWLVFGLYRGSGIIWISQVFPKFHKKSPSFAPSFKSWEKLGEKLGKQGFGKEWSFIRKKNYKGRCEKRAVAKCDGICKTYDRLQDRMVDILSEDRSVRKIRCNVLMEGTEYVSDIVCTMEDGSTVVYECCYRHLLKRPVTAKLIQQSREYWLRHGVKDGDWRLIVNAEERIVEEG